jgi:hypothetical protein
MQQLVSRRSRLLGTGAAAVAGTAIATGAKMMMVLPAVAAAAAKVWGVAAATIVVLVSLT